jgi:predicted O-methyltransferase YrrM
MSYTNPDVNSSYKYNNLGKTLYQYVLYEKPQIVVDFGVLDGYSTIALAMGCRENGFGKVKVYDLFEDYEYNHSNFEKLVKNLGEYGLLDWVEIEKKNFFDWVKDPEPFQLLHLDISNTGDIIDLLIPIKDRGTILFEGGSEQRDHVGWLLKYNKKPIKGTKAEFQVVNPLFPSLSKLL